MFSQSREVTEMYSSGGSASLRFGQMFLRMFAGLLGFFCIGNDRRE